MKIARKRAITHENKRKSLKGVQNNSNNNNNDNKNRQLARLATTTAKTIKTNTTLPAKKQHTYNTTAKPKVPKKVKAESRDCERRSV